MHPVGGTQLHRQKIDGQTGVPRRQYQDSRDPRQSRGPATRVCLVRPGHWPVAEARAMTSLDGVRSANRKPSRWHSNVGLPLARSCACVALPPEASMVPDCPSSHGSTDDGFVTAGAFWAVVCGRLYGTAGALRVCSIYCLGRRSGSSGFVNLENAAAESKCLCVGGRIRLLRGSGVKVTDGSYDRCLPIMVY